MHDEVIKIPIQVRVTSRKSSRTKTTTTISYLNNSNIPSTPYPKDCGKGITLNVLNARSLNNKAAIFTNFNCEHQPDVLAATET